LSSPSSDIVFNKPGRDCGKRYQGYVVYQIYQSIHEKPARLLMLLQQGDRKQYQALKNDAKGKTI